MIFVPDIFDFFSAQTFVALQNKFFDYDERHLGFNQYNFIHGKDLMFTDVISKDFSIMYKAHDDKGKETFRELYFYKDFLHANMTKLAENKISEVKRELNSNFRYKTLERKEYLDELLLNLRELDAKTFTTVFLNNEFKLELWNQIRIIENFIHHDRVWKSPKDENNRIKLKLTRAEIICLFYLLRQKGLTESKHDNELGRLIDESFMYYNEMHKSYKPITAANKMLSGLRNGDKPSSTVLSNLKKLLTDEKFYEIEQ